MAETFDDWRRKVSDKIGAPVLEMVAVQPRGSAGAGGASIGLSKVSPLAGMLVSKAQGAKSNKKSGGLGKITSWSTKSAILAATADRVYAFEAKQGMGGLKLKDPLYVWDRQGFTVHAEPKKMTAAIDITVPTGETYELESMTLGGGGKLIEQFVAELGTAPA
jgi:hypothetical protein